MPMSVAMPPARGRRADLIWIKCTDAIGIMSPRNDATP
ncbi:hypothetical protein NK6_8394 [Bradyrhizobium diazoefficiens]|uniref:Uncharacterized protein n=1 Tax=Bradyrhizobium diazoefficiens TaxID=1355477 RepID=A0A0E4FXD4_9BRAD|nr:hypothetical protein NK6_8394 [Bradyrhizobium diazoefficiens]